MEKAEEPGTALYGNFINYYSFNPAEKRTSLLPHNLLQQILTDKKLLSAEEPSKVSVLDLGCNSGEMTVALYDKLQSESSSSHKELKFAFLGVDVDEKLIQRCNASHKYEAITFRTVNIMDEDDRRDEISDWMKQKAITCFDLVTCFSITMWIHLNHGDDGLRDFLRYIASKAHYLIVEPQPWKCYRNANRRMKKLDCAPFKYFDELTWRTDVDEKIIDFLVEECGMTLCETFGKTNWDRRICLLSS